MREFSSVAIALSLVSLFIYLVISYNNSNVDFIWNKVNVDIIDADKYNFVSRSDIDNIINEFNYHIGETHIDNLDIYAIQSRLLENVYINKAFVYTGVDGSLNFVVSQFEPVLLFNTPVGLYMLNSNGDEVLVNGAISAKVRYITTENTKNEFNKFFKHSINKNISIAEITKIICNFVDKIESDDLLSKLIVQININQIGEVELIPRFGADIITLCDLVDLEKCSGFIYKLKSFYYDISSKNYLEVYSAVNMKYKNQIVAI